MISIRGVPRAFDEQAQIEIGHEDHGGPWPAWIPLDDVLERVPSLVQAYVLLSDAGLTVEGARLAELMCGPCGAYLTDETRRDELRGRQLEQWEVMLDTLARTLAIGSLTPGGIQLWGIGVVYQ